VPVPYWLRTISSTVCHRLMPAFFLCRNTPTNKKEVVLLLQLRFFSHYYADERNLCFVLFTYCPNIPHHFPSSILRSLFYSITSISIKCTLTLKIMLFIIWTLCQICLFKFIRVEGGVKFMKHSKGGASYKFLRTSALVRHISHNCQPSSPPGSKHCPSTAPETPSHRSDFIVAGGL
jgi:hypothetical protein